MFPLHYPPALLAQAQRPPEALPVVARQLVRYDGVAPTPVSGSTLLPIALLPGDEVTLMIASPSDEVTGRRLKWSMKYKTERAAGRKGCKKKIDRLDNEIKGQRRTTARLFVDFAPAVQFSGQGEMRLSQRRTVYVAEKAGQIAPAALFKTDNLVLEGGAPLLPAEHAFLAGIQGQVARRAVGPVAVKKQVLPGSLNGLTLEIVVRRPRAAS